MTKSSSSFKKPCICCKETKSSEDFYKHKGMTDGLLNKCKPCVRQYAHVYRMSNLERIKERDKNRPNKEERYRKNALYSRDNYEKIKPSRASWIKANLERYKEFARKWRENNRVKISAQAKLRRALLSGVVEKKPCQICGEKIVEAHHHDYNFPLSVLWLCIKHHKESHRKYNPLDISKLIPF